ncbi:MAG: excinuclease ABC subunit UvrB [Campylobacterota bacterium]|nr:excinuclease ABC subunit UvrB [Campylobacterota bacterium]
MALFTLHSHFQPAGDQVKAIENLTKNIESDVKYQTLLGVTGSGKTFTIASVIAQISKPVLVISHNKTLAAQLYNEFKHFFSENAVEYFISYYDYYQPEAYIPRTDTYIDKDASINDEIDRLRQKATTSLLTRRDVIIVASVSCIYGIGSKEEYSGMRLHLHKGDNIDRKSLLSQLIEMQYKRNDIDFQRATFRVRGEVVDVYPAYMRNTAIRTIIDDNIIESIFEFDPLTGKLIQSLDDVVIFPASFYVTSKLHRIDACQAIREELKERLNYFRSQGKLLEVERLETRVNFDLEMLEEIGYCPGIENYSRYLSGRKAGEPPAALIDYFGDNFLTIVDESHVTIPQLHGMYNGDYSRKKSLVGYGFRLPSALDNRPLKFEEFEKKLSQVIFVSATPSDWEKEKSKPHIIEQVIRPTGLVDPPVEIRALSTAVDDLYKEINERAEKNERVLVTTLTKRMAEDLTEYYTDLGLKVKYMHADIESLKRAKIIKDLREKKFDCLIGINLLREGLDIPEVSLVAILDADKEGFLRSKTSLIQTSGRAARNVKSLVIFYASKVTQSMQGAIREMERRRKKQLEYNAKHHIIPYTISKSTEDSIAEMCEMDYRATDKLVELSGEYIEKKKLPKVIRKLTLEMQKASKALDFETAAALRDKISALKELDLQR